MTQFSTHPTLRCSARTMPGEGICGKPTFCADGVPMHRGFCLDCILISCYIGGELHVLGAMAGSEDVSSLLLPPIVEKFINANKIHHSLSTGLLG